MYVAAKPSKKNAKKTFDFSGIVFAYMVCFAVECGWWWLEESSCKIFSKSRRKKNKNAEIVLLLSLNSKSCRNLNFSYIFICNNVLRKMQHRSL
jgi:hypothetical protein